MLSSSTNGERKGLTTAKLKLLSKLVQETLKWIKEVSFDFVLFFFKNVNAQIGSTLTLFRMKEETSDHLHMLFRVFKYAILPASICFALMGVLFGENMLDSMVWWIPIFVYGSFLPDLPSAFRQKKGEERIGDLGLFKKYTLFLLAPVFVWLLFSDIGVVWKTTETFHNFKSLFVFAVFLALLGFVAFGSWLQPLLFSFFGLMGYLAHLKVDKIW